MAKVSKDATRLLGIMMMLFRNNAVTRSQLVDEFAVHERTIYRYLAALRDMELIQLQEGETYVRTPAADLIKQSGLLRSFADFADVSKFLPVGRADFWQKLPARIDEKHIVVTTSTSEADVQVDLQHHFALLEKAIQERRYCQFSYKNTLRKIEPYSLFYFDGVWYLAAAKQQQIKMFRLSGIKWAELMDKTFTPDPVISAILHQQKTPWCSPERTTVMVNVASEVADYFRHQEQLPDQEIIESRADGSLLLTTQISHQKQLFPVIRFWLPHLRIVEPVEWQQQLEEELKTVLGVCDTP
ncbi:helix-turn-helix transcriptional regulator [Buttiauxella massiliensis]|uniref:helix-turn-helix transcriptional regulator n=1 Tax=Buttiauxella massiliensis TaxID=2831590 RepID=UPI001869C8ED|nr:WYL domain-containing protein [Buttiauxella massiliensis]